MSSLLRETNESPFARGIREGMERRAADFNAKFPVGSVVHFRKADGSLSAEKIRTAAKVDSGDIVIRLVGIAGPKGLHRIQEAR
jgi:hypothetical protein